MCGSRRAWERTRPPWRLARVDEASHATSVSGRSSPPATIAASPARIDASQRSNPEASTARMSSSRSPIWPRRLAIGQPPLPPRSCCTDTSESAHRISPSQVLRPAKRSRWPSSTVSLVASATARKRSFLSSRPATGGPAVGDGLDVIDQGLDGGRASVHAQHHQPRTRTATRSRTRTATRIREKIRRPPDRPEPRVPARNTCSGVGIRLCIRPATSCHAPPADDRQPGQTKGSRSPPGSSACPARRPSTPVLGLLPARGPGRGRMVKGRLQAEREPERRRSRSGGSQRPFTGRDRSGTRPARHWWSRAAGGQSMRRITTRRS